MKRFFQRLTCIAVAAALLFAAIPVQAQEDLAPDAKAAVLMEAETGRILYAKNEQAQLPMASTTKILTALIALEHCSLQDVVTVAEEAVGVEGSSIYLSAGQHITVEDLLYGLMLSSGNDAALALACHISGSPQDFAQLMNQTAQQLGAYNSNFITPNGLDAPDHYTTAYDLALITCRAMQNADFVRIVSTQSTRIDHPNRPVQNNKNKLLASYEGANGVKTGYTSKAGRCLVAAARQADMQLVAVVLNCGPMFEQCAQMLDYGFSHYQMQTVVPAGECMGQLDIAEGKQEQVDVIAARDVRVPLAQDEPFTLSVSLPGTLPAPVPAGQAVGYVCVDLGDISRTGTLITRETVARRSWLDVLYGWFPGRSR